MLVIGNYGITQYPNQIVINLPQTMETLSNTVSPIDSRKKALSSEQLSVILAMTKKMFEEEE